VIAQRSAEDVLAALEAMRAGDTDWRGGRAVDDVRRDPQLARAGSAPMYGMAGKLPIRRLVASRVRRMIAELYTRGGS
jgi:hypothetical protein